MGPSDRDTAVRRTTLHAVGGCPTPAELALALACELGDADAELVLGAPEIEGDAEAQLRALGTHALPARRDGGPELLLIDHALERGEADPLLVAIVLAELGRRAGMPVGIVGGSGGHFVAHQRLREPLLLDPVSGGLVDAGQLGVLHWRCGHQIAAELLDLLQPRYERTGDLRRALHVARLRLALPFDDMSVAQRRLHIVSARLN